MKEPKKLSAAHPRARNSPRRTAPGDFDLRAQASYGYWATESWNGVDVTYHNHVGGYGQGPISDLKVKRPIAALCVIVSDPDPTKPLGAAMNHYGRSITSPTESSWIQAPNTQKAGKAIWSKFVQLMKPKGYTWDDMYLIMCFGLPKIISTPDEKRPTRFYLPLYREDERLDKQVWKRWYVDHYEHQREDKHDYHDKLIKADCPVQFEEFKDPEESHPAVRANAIAYYCMMSAFSFSKGFFLKDFEPE